MSPVFWRYVKENGSESVVLSGAGLSTVVPGSHPRFRQLLDYLDGCGNPDARRIRELTDVGTGLAVSLRRLSERVSFDGTHLRFDGDLIDTSLSRHIVRMIRDGDENYARWVRFLEHLAANPSRRSRMHLFTWLADRDFTLLPDGHLLGYKGVGSDGLSISSGTAIVNGVKHHGRIPNPVGATVEMPRQEVNPDRDHGCSTGLHVGTHDYASGFGQRLLLVSVNPRDVVAVPRDCEWQKMRVCRYTVLDVHDRPGPVTAPSYGDDDVFPRDSGGTGSGEDDDPDDGFGDGWLDEDECA